MALVVGRLEAKLGTVEVVVGEEKAAEVVEICDTLAGGIESERWRMLGDVGEELICESGFSTLCTVSCAYETQSCPTYLE